MAGAPLAAAIVQAAAERGIALAEVRDFDAPVGKGVTGSIDGHFVVIGNRHLLCEACVDPRPLEAAEPLRQEGATAIFVASDQKPAGRRPRASAHRCATPATG